MLRSPVHRENLLTGAYTRSHSRAELRKPGKVYAYFPRLKTRRVPGRLHLGRRAADVRHRPRADGQTRDDPARRTLHGPRPQIVEEIFEIVKDLNSKENVSFLLAEQNTMVALRYADFGYILENGRVVMEGDAADPADERRCEGQFYLGLSSEPPAGALRRLTEEFPDVKHYRRRKRRRVVVVRALRGASDPTNVL